MNYMIQAADEDRVAGMVEESGLFGYTDFRFFALRDVVNGSDEIDAAAACVEDGGYADFAIFDSGRILRDLFPPDGWLVRGES